MDRLEPFLLEDFFYEYEHRSDLINLASSDSLPWTQQELEDKLGTSLIPITLAYPDVRRLLIPGLEAVCEVPRNWAPLPTTGAAEAIALTMHDLATGSKPNSIAVPWPTYGAFFGLAKLLGIEVRTYGYQQERNWKLNELDLMRLAQECDAVIVVNPHNPTGQRIDDTVWQKLANLLIRQKKTLVIDEVFRLEGERSIFADLAQAGCDVIRIGSLSKTYGLPGLRLGWVIAREARISRMRTIQQYLTLSPAAATVAWAHNILNHLPAFSRAELIHHNRKLLLDWADSNKNRVSISTPQGGTTVAIQFNWPVTEDQAFDAFVKAGVLLVPGSRFGLRAARFWFRLGYGTRTSKLKEGLERMATAMT